MDEDMLKNWGSGDSSMDMMMQMEKFPELLCEQPFYNNNNNNNTLNLNLTNAAEKEFSSLTVTATSINPPFSSSNFANNSMIPPSLQVAQSSSEKKSTNMAAMREMIFRMAVMQPIHIDPESIKPRKRRNVKISKDPQSVAARHRRERISERIRILQRLVPGGTKMDTASMLDEAIHYVKFLKKQVQTLEQAGVSARRPGPAGFNVVGFPGVVSNGNDNYSANLLLRGCQPCQMIDRSSFQTNAQLVDKTTYKWKVKNQ